MATTTTNYNLTKPTMAEIADIRTLNNNMDKVDEVMHSTQVSLAPAYDLLETYNTGDIVMYELLMYKCKDDNVTGAWNPAKWERTTAGENGSGGGGSSVVPNPQGSPTDTLETIEIDGTVYDIAGSGGGSGGKSGYSSTKIWDYTEDNNNTIPFGSYTASLNDDINNYDMLVIESVSSRGDLTDPNWASTNLWYVDVNALNNNWNNNYVTYTSWNQRATKFHIINTTFEALSNNGSDTNGLVRVYGINYGGGRGSEIIPISAGDGTTSRTFTFDKTPKAVQFYWDDPVLEGTGWIGNGSFVWGQEYITFPAHTRASSVTGMMGGCAVLSYGADGKSVTINGANAFQSLNTPNGSGFIFVEYGGAGGSGGGASEYIPYSNKNNIVCEATLNNFDASSLEWGDGESPIILSQTVSMYNNEAVSIPVNTSGVIAYSDIGGNKQPFTAYMVCKAQTSGNYTRLLSALESHATNMGAMIFGTNNINMGSWNGSTPTGLSATSDYIVCAIQYIGYGLGYCKVNNIDLSPFPLIGSNRYIMIGRTDGGSGGDQEPCDILVKYFGVVEGTDTHKAINENVAYLMDKFGIN